MARSAVVGPATRWGRVLRRAVDLGQDHGGRACGARCSASKDPGLGHARHTLGGQSLRPHLEAFRSEALGASLFDVPIARVVGRHQCLPAGNRKRSPYVIVSHTAALPRPQRAHRRNGLRLAAGAPIPISLSKRARGRVALPETLRASHGAICTSGVAPVWMATETGDGRAVPSLSVAIERANAPGRSTARGSILW